MFLRLAWSTRLALAIFAFGFATASSGNAQCSSGERYLPMSGLCSGEASGLLGWPDKFFYDGLVNFGCQAEAAETPFPGDQVLLYWAANCQSGPAKLEVSAGAGQAILNIVSGGGLTSAGSPLRVGYIIGADDGNSPTNLLRWTRDAMSADGYGQAAKDACTAVRAGAYAKDAWVIDNAMARKARPKDAYPEMFCGGYGYTGDSRSYWRVFGGHSWFFTLGQDGYVDFDPNTMRLLARKAQPAFNLASPLPGSAGVTNIAGEPGTSEQFYGSARNYTIYSGSDRLRLRYCVAERDFGGSILRIGFDGGQWQLAVPYGSDPDYYGEFDVDGHTAGLSGTAANGWTFAWISAPHLDAIKEGNLMILDIGKASLDFTLDGSTAAILKVQECVQRLR